MKEHFLLSAFLSITFLSAAQKSAFVYVISAAENEASWMNIQMMNSKKGELVQTIYDYRKQHPAIIDIETNQQRTTSGGTFPTYTSVAAAAYDGKTQRMFFIPMRIAELRWADVRTPSEAKYYTTSSPQLHELNLNDPANHITRMVIAADGYGYAITNDGNHFYRFTTGKKPQLTDLGNLVDAADNGAMSVHSQCNSWGGDVVAGLKTAAFSRIISSCSNNVISAFVLNLPVIVCQKRMSQPRFLSCILKICAIEVGADRV